MEGFWYYNSDEKPIGPLTFAELEIALSRLSKRHSVLIWHTSFDNWRLVQSVPELRAIPSLMESPRSESGLIIEPLEERVSRRNDKSQSTSWRKIGGHF